MRERDSDQVPDPVPSAAAMGATLSDTQIKRLKIAIAIMSLMMIVGMVTLIARVIYLASGRPEQARMVGTAPQTLPDMVVDAKLLLPAGTSLKSTQLSGNRLVAHYAGGQREGVMILDLATGKLLSHVRIGD
jgi:hypothetical protein